MACMLQVWGEDVDISVLQLNLWVQGSNVPGGEQGISDVIEAVDPDVVLLCEVTGSKERFLDTLVASLGSKGHVYHADTLGLGMGVLSKSKPVRMSHCFTLDDHTRPNPVCKVAIDWGGMELVFYSVHWDWTHYECYMPRGYSGTTWQKLPAPATDAAEVLAANRESFRDEGVAALIADARGEIAAGNMVILGGDFNEPSHLDWQADTRLLRDHNGLVIDWDCSRMLADAGFSDCYREMFPDAVADAGFTYPAGNRYAELSKLVWLPDKDERDRIDFIYYHPHKQLQLTGVQIVGPAYDIVRGHIEPSPSCNHLLDLPVVWPSDHKGMLCKFRISGAAPGRRH